VNKKQKIVFLVGVGIIVLMGLIPPWYYHAVFSENQRTAFEFDGGYQFLFSPDLRVSYKFEKYFPPRERPCINLSRLLVQWAVVAIATAGIVLVFKDHNGKAQQ
jgi:hypothetical protein